MIELAIVLVIVGIILAAVLKGEDVIRGARHKNFINEVGRNFPTTAFMVLDWQGRLPGANKDNGLITLNPKTDIGMMQLAHSPDPVKQYGSSLFYIFYGNEGGKNIIVVLPDTTGGAFDKEQITFLEALDVAYDPSPDATDGQVRGTVTAPAAVSTAAWLATYTSTPAFSAYQANTTKALIYYFDKKL